MTAIPVTLHLDKSPSAFKRGGLAKAARAVAAAGRHGDTVVVHINPDELDELIKTWGPPTINPSTGLPEFFLGKLFKKVKKVAKKVLPIAAPLVGSVLFPGIGSAIGGALGLSGTTGAMIGNALAGAVPGLIAGGPKGAAIGAASGAASGLLAPSISGFLTSNFPETSSFLGITAPNAATGISGGSSGFDLSSLGGGAGADIGNAAGNAAAAGAASLGGAGGGSSWFDLGGSKLPTAALAALPMIANALGGAPKGAKPPEKQPSLYGEPLNVPEFNRGNPAMFAGDYSKYGQPGQGGEQQFFNNNALPTIVAAIEAARREEEEEPRRAATGGAIAQMSRTPSRVVGQGTGRTDDVPAVLSDGEFVIDAETVAMLGDGSSDAGAKKLEQMRQGVRRHKGKALAKGKFSPNAKPALAYMRGSNGVR